MLIVELNNLSLLNSLAKAFLIGVKGYSSECFKKFELEEVKEIIKRIKKDQKLAYIDLTQIYHDSDLLNVKNIIDELKEADGFFYFDLGIMEFIDEDKRIYYAPTYMTNQYDIDLALLENKLVLVSPELSLLELNRIKYSDSLILHAFGPWEIFHSRRPLISNYFKYRNQNFDAFAKYHVIEEFRSDKYPIVEENGTKIYLNGFFYLGKELDNKTSNLLIKTFDLDESLANKVVEIYSTYQNNKTFDIEKALIELGLDLNKGLLYEESVLRKGGCNE